MNKFKAFAHKQRQAERASKGKDVKKASTLFITCKQCTTGQRLEMTCRICYETKGLAWFAKAQRKNPDEARCLECMRATELVLPISADDVVGDGILEDDEDEDDDDILSIKDSRRNEEYFVKERSGVSIKPDYQQPAHHFSNTILPTTMVHQQFQIPGVVVLHLRLTFLNLSHAELSLEDQTRRTVMIRLPTALYDLQKTASLLATLLLWVADLTR